jgi:putative DNA primase/helicase
MPTPEQIENAKRALGVGIHRPAPMNGHDEVGIRRVADLIRGLKQLRTAGNRLVAFRKVLDQLQPDAHLVRADQIAAIISEAGVYRVNENDPKLNIEALVRTSLAAKSVVAPIIARPAVAVPSNGHAGKFPGDIPLTQARRDKPTPRPNPGKPDAGVHGGALKTAKASSYTMRGITWMWPNRFALGKLGLIGGLPDKGKGLIGAFLAACVTNKQPLPCNEGETPQGSVLIFTAEDDIEDTIIPRLIAAGADLDKVHIVQVMGEPNGKERTFSMITDLPALEAKLDEIGDVVLVEIDPMSAYIGVGKANVSSTGDVRGFLKPLTDLAAKKKISIIGIMHFNKKADVTNAMLRIADSLAYVAAARHVYVVVDDPETEDQRLFVKAKNNLSTDKKALSYMTGARNVGNDPETKQEIWAPHVEWGAKHVSITANDAMQAEAGGNKSSYARHEAEEFLRKRLADGPVKQKEIADEAEANCIAKRTLERAKKQLNVISRKNSKEIDGEWMWSLPETPKSYNDQERER